MNGGLQAIRHVTNGEALLSWLSAHHYSESSGSRLMGQRFLVLTGRPTGMGQYVEGIVVAYSFSRLMVAAKCLYSTTKDIETCMGAMRSYVREWFHWLDNDDRNRLVRLTKEAWESSDTKISKKTRSELWSGARNHRCYMCGSLLSRVGNRFVDEQGGLADLDHIWPSSFGGDSVADNLLPACEKCNKEKRHMCTWESGHAHGVIYPIGFDSHEFFANVPRIEKILIHRRAAFELARINRWTLKTAFLRLGPYSALEAIDSGDTWDFLNLQNHSVGIGETLWQPS